MIKQEALFFICLTNASIWASAITTSVVDIIVSIGFSTVAVVIFILKVKK